MSIFRRRFRRERDGWGWAEVLSGMLEAVVDFLGDLW